jgi:hypothetical protein
VGSPNVIFEGTAGAYPVHIFIRPPEVIPGLAEISVRVESGNVEQVTALPIKWNAGRNGAPPPDVAKSVPGETNLYHAELWFMESGAQSVEVEIRGASGIGRVTIPVDAVARRVLNVPRMLGVILLLTGFILVAFLVSLVGAAVRESVLIPGWQPTPGRTLGARVAMTGTALLITFLLWGGKHWWDAEAADYRHNRLYQPLESRVQVRVAKNQRILRLEINDSKFARSAPLIADHGKLMHLFLIREPGLDAFAHLHPLKLNRKTFEIPLPELPSGSYRMYADVTYETGFSDTITSKVELPEQPAAGKPVPGNRLVLGVDDSWRIAIACPAALNTNRSALGEHYTMTSLQQDPIVENEPTRLRFAVAAEHGEPIALEPYLGMRGHLALRNEEGSVFTHLHPGGSASMAALQLSTLRSEGKLPLKAAFGADDPLCELPLPSDSEQIWLNGGQTEGAIVSFPYVFPRAGTYRLWVQVKIRGEILTGVFDLAVRKQDSHRSSGNLVLGLAPAAQMNRAAINFPRPPRP